MSTAPASAPAAPNRLALWSLILGIAAICLSPIAVGAAFGLVAIILGVVALTRPGRIAMAVSGLTMGAFSLPLTVVAIMVLAVASPAPTKPEQVRRSRTIVDMAQVKAALVVYKLDVGHLPSTEDGLESLLSHPLQDPHWGGPYLERFPLDHWGHPLIYRYPGKTNPDSYDLLSAGPDGVEGTPDDIHKDAAI